MAKSKSGLSDAKRAKELKRLGFAFSRQGKGSHQIWEHEGLKNLAQSGGSSIPEAPANLRNAIGQKPWEITVPGDPASGTWRAITKYAEWCNQVTDGKLGGVFNSVSSDRRGEPAPHTPANNGPRHGHHGGGPRHGRPGL